MAVAKDSGFPSTRRVTSPGSTSDTWTAFTTPATNRMLVALFLANGSSCPAITSFTSPNLTWTNRVAIVDGGNNWRVEIWTAFAAAVVTNEVITHVHAAGFYTQLSLVLFSLDGSDASGVGNTGTRTSTTNPTVDITATAAGSLLLAGLPYRSAGGDIGVDANTTSEYDAGAGGGFGFNERAGSRASAGAGSLTLGFTTGQLYAMGVMGGIEIKAAAAAGAPFPPFPRSTFYVPN